MYVFRRPFFYPSRVFLPIVLFPAAAAPPVGGTQNYVFNSWVIRAVA